MMYLFVQTWLFLGIAWMVGIVIGFMLARDQKAQRHKEVEAELLDARDRAITRDKEIDEYRLRVAELEGLPEGARASRVAARDEMITRMTQLERDLDTAKTNEKRLSEEGERLRGEVDGFRTRYLEARAKWDEYQTKAEALASAPPQAAPLDLGSVSMMPDDTMRERVMELEGQLAETLRTRDKALEQIKTLTGRVRDLETQPAAAAATGDAKVLQARIAELEGRLASSFASARETDALKSRVSDLQDKLSEAEVALSKAVSSTKTAAGAEPLKARISDLEAQLAEARANPAVVELGSARDDGESQRLRSRLSETEAKLADAQRQAGEAQNLRSRLADLEQALDKAKRQANEAQALRAQITSLEARLAAHTDDRATSSEDVSLLKARLADVEARLMSGSQSSVEFDSLRNRVMTLEALLHEAAKSRDEAAILRSKVAELDGRLGQALKAAAEIREKA